MAPKPIPASTTASMTANAVVEDTTYSRRNRNQITSSASRTQPVPKLTTSKVNGGRYRASKRNGSLECADVSAPLTAVPQPRDRRIPNLAISTATIAAVQTDAPAARLVPRSPNAPIRYTSPSNAPNTAPNVFAPYRTPIARPKFVWLNPGSSIITGKVKPITVVGTSRIRKDTLNRSPSRAG